MYIDRDDASVAQQSNIFFTNTKQYVQLKMLEDSYQLPNEVKYHFENIEKCFCDAFDLVERLFSGKINKFNPPNINLQVLNEILYEFEIQLDQHYRVMIGDQQKKYDLVLWSKVYRTVFYCDKSTYDFSFVSNQTITKELHDAAVSLLSFTDLFKTLPKDQETEYLSQLQKFGIKSVKNIKIINLKPNEARKKSNLDCIHSLFQFDADKYLNTPVFERFISILPTSLNFVICPPNLSGFNYMKRTIELDSPSNHDEFSLSSFKFSDEPSIGTDRYVTSLGIEISRLKTLFHEGGHAICDFLTGIFSILDSKSGTVTDATLDVAMHMFNKIDLKVKKEALNAYDSFKNDRNNDYNGFYQFCLQQCPRSNVFMDVVPPTFDDIPLFLEKMTSKESAERSLFNSEREVLQQFGFIIFGDVMYVYNLCDIQFQYQFKTPFQSEHNAGVDPIVLKEKSVSYDDIFREPNNFFFSVINHSHELLDFNLEKNREFIDLLFKLQGLDLNKYECEMKQKYKK